MRLITRLKLKKSKINFDLVNDVKIPFSTHTKSLEALLQVCILALTKARMLVNDKKDLSKKDITINGFDTGIDATAQTSKNTIPKPSKKETATKKVKHLFDNV